MFKFCFCYNVRWFCFISFIFLFASCEKSEKDIETENIKNFQSLKPKLEMSVTHIKKKYLINSYFELHKVSHIIPNETNKIRNNIYYDSFLGSLLKNENIRLISLRDDTSCNYSELFFEIRSVSGRQYYYVYRFCGSNFKQISESLNYKLIPLNKEWSLEIEKN